MWDVLILNLVLILFRETLSQLTVTVPTTILHDPPRPVEGPDTSKFGTNLVTELRNDANLDLSQDEEYEDLRAELLAYKTALVRLSDITDTRRSMMTTPCWKMQGICVNYKLCSGFRFLTEVPGCRDRHNVCCFTWNRYQVKDFRDHGIDGPFPWSIHEKPYGPSKPLDGLYVDVSDDDDDREKEKTKLGLKLTHNLEDIQEEDKSNSDEDGFGKVKEVIRVRKLPKVKPLKNRKKKNNIHESRLKYPNDRYKEGIFTKRKRRELILSKPEVIDSKTLALILQND